MGVADCNSSGFSQNTSKVILTSIWPFARHTANRCMYFPAFPMSICVTDLGSQSKPFASFPSSSYLRVNMGCALVIVYQAHSLNVTNRQATFYGTISGSP